MEVSESPYLLILRLFCLEPKSPWRKIIGLRVAGSFSGPKTWKERSVRINLDVEKEREPEATLPINRAENMVPSETDIQWLVEG